ncbi:hypothetical protein [Lacrimispora sp.]|nr:hypothetical protein [Lacrimispora sp.]
MTGFITGKYWIEPKGRMRDAIFSLKLAASVRQGGNRGYVM